MLSVLNEPVRCPGDPHKEDNRRGFHTNQQTMSKQRKMDFLEHTKGGMSVLGFWTEGGKGMLVRSLERNHVDDVLREWQIADVVVTEHKVLLKWQKRSQPLTDKELKEQYR